MRRGLAFILIFALALGFAVLASASAGALLSLQNDVLCNGFEIQRRDCLFIRSLADSTKKHRVQTAVFSLSISAGVGRLVPHS